MRGKLTPRPPHSLPGSSGEIVLEEQRVVVLWILLGLGRGDTAPPAGGAGGATGSPGGPPGMQKTVEGECKRGIRKEDEERQKGREGWGMKMR